jgi:hypothetical protein
MTNIDANATINGQSLQDLLRVSSDDIAAALNKTTLRKAVEQDSGFTGWLATAQWPALSQSVATGACSLLSDNVVDIFAGAWCKYKELTQCAEETLAPPGSTSTVTLADHDFTYEIEPSLEILIDGKKVGTIPFAVAVTFTVKAMMLEIASGCVGKVQSGRLSWSASLNCGSSAIWTRELGGLDLPGELKLKQPISILRSKSEASRRTAGQQQK